MWFKTGKLAFWLWLLFGQFPVFGQQGLGSTSSQIKFETSPSGLQYKYFQKSDTGQQVGEGGFIRMHLLMITERDSVIDNTFKSPNQPAELIIATPTHTGCIFEGLSMLRGGDSVMFRVVADSLYQKTFSMQLPDFIKPGEHIILLIKVVQSLNKEAWAAKEEAEQKQLALEASQQLDEDTKKLTNFAGQKGYAHLLTSTPGGVMYVKLTTTNGPTAKTGEEGSFYYVGTLLNGEVFDDNIGKEPLKTTIGEGGLITGWLEVLDKIRLGEKWLVLIPSGLAYGSEGKNEIEPNSPLIFEIELVKIRTAEQVRFEKFNTSKKLKAEENQKIGAFLKKKNFKNLKKEVVDSSAFYYQIEKAGSGLYPKMGDTVSIKISVFDLDGKPIEALTRKESPFELTIMESLWPALQSSLQKINKGGQIRIISPSKLFQGEDESAEWSGFTPLMVEIELVDIKFANR